MAEQFKVGDVVTLRSGGPDMTVTDVGYNVSRKPTVWCTWFIGTNQESGAFPPDALRPAEEG